MAFARVIGVVLWGLTACSSGDDSVQQAPVDVDAAADPPEAEDAGDLAEAPPLDAGDSLEDAAAPPTVDLPMYLSETGLYADIEAKTLAEGVRWYQVKSPLWADEAGKDRWIWLPPDTQIDTSDMDQWSFPGGTKLWKAFASDGKVVETRLIEKKPSGEWEMVAYQWDADHLDAVAVPEGVADASDTSHDIPEAMDCTWCHEGRDDRVLGFTALQLSHDLEGPTLMTLAEEGLLTDPPDGPFVFPGDDVSRPALEYMHANCGHCHNPTRSFALGCSHILETTSTQCEGIPDNPRVGRGQLVFFFWQSVRELDSFEQTITYKSVVEPRDTFLWPEGIVTRMAMRGGGEQMPPVGTELVDDTGFAAVEAWVESLRPLFPDGQ